MRDGLLNDGRPVLVESESDRIGRGPWARLLACAAVPDESSSTAERGRMLARAGAVHTVRVATGELSAVVADGGEERAAAIGANPVPPRIWAAVVRSARGNESLEAGVEGRRASVHLEHMMSVDWEEPLVPPARALRSRMMNLPSSSMHHAQSSALPSRSSSLGRPAATQIKTRRMPACAPTRR